MGGDGRGKDDVGIAKEERSGKPPSPTPTTREFPPTDAELEFLDRLRKADAIGMDSLLLAVMNGRDVVKPFIVNGLMDLHQHLRRLEQQVNAAAQNNASAQRETKARLEQLEKGVDEEIQKVIDSARFAAEMSKWLSLPWMQRRKTPKPGVKP
ncbi:MAG: hypothetical protein JXB32_24905 [Deltaproteobacteria bacterium]|nr:hypothetical protein [Deltaproteobacteria bacterium]